MLGPEKVRDLDRPILTSLEALVPAGNFYRHLDAMLDLGFVRAWVEDRYAVNGRPSMTGLSIATSIRPGRRHETLSHLAVQ